MSTKPLHDDESLELQLDSQTADSTLNMENYDFDRFNSYLDNAIQKNAPREKPPLFIVQRPNSSNPALISRSASSAGQAKPYQHPLIVPSPSASPVKKKSLIFRAPSSKIKKNISKKFGFRRREKNSIPENESDFDNSDLDLDDVPMPGFSPMPAAGSSHNGSSSQASSSVTDGEEYFKLNIANDTSNYAAMNISGVDLASDSHDIISGSGPAYEPSINNGAVHHGSNYDLQAVFKPPLVPSSLNSKPSLSINSSLEFLSPQSEIHSNISLTPSTTTQRQRPTSNTTLQGKKLSIGLAKLPASEHSHFSFKPLPPMLEGVYENLETTLKSSPYDLESASLSESIIDNEYTRLEEINTQANPEIPVRMRPYNSPAEQKHEQKSVEESTLSTDGDSLYDRIKEVLEKIKEIDRKQPQAASDVKSALDKRPTVLRRFKQQSISTKLDLFILNIDSQDDLNDIVAKRGEELVELTPKLDLSSPEMESNVLNQAQKILREERLLESRTSRSLPNPYEVLNENPYAVMRDSKNSFTMDTESKQSKPEETVSPIPTKDYFGKLELELSDFFSELVNEATDRINSLLLDGEAQTKKNHDSLPLLLLSLRTSSASSRLVETTDSPQSSVILPHNPTIIEMDSKSTYEPVNPFELHQSLGIDVSTEDEFEVMQSDFSALSVLINPNLTLAEQKAMLREKRLLKLQRQEQMMASRKVDTLAAQRSASGRRKPRSEEAWRHLDSQIDEETADLVLLNKNFFVTNGRRTNDIYHTMKTDKKKTRRPAPDPTAGMSAYQKYINRNKTKAGKRESIASTVIRNTVFHEIARSDIDVSKGKSIVDIYDKYRQKDPSLFRSTMVTAKDITGVEIDESFFDDRQKSSRRVLMALLSATFRAPVVSGSRGPNSRISSKSLTLTLTIGMGDDATASRLPQLRVSVKLNESTRDLLERTNKYYSSSIVSMDAYVESGAADSDFGGFEASKPKGKSVNSEVSMLPLPTVENMHHASNNNRDEQRKVSPKLAGIRLLNSPRALSAAASRVASPRVSRGASPRVASGASSPFGSPRIPRASSKGMKLSHSPGQPSSRGPSRMGSRDVSPKFNLPLGCGSPIESPPMAGKTDPRSFTPSTQNAAHPLMDPRVFSPTAGSILGQRTPEITSPKPYIQSKYKEKTVLQFLAVTSPFPIAGDFVADDAPPLPNQHDPIMMMNKDDLVSVDLSNSELAVQFENESVATEDIDEDIVRERGQLADRKSAIMRVVSVDDLPNASDVEAIFNKLNYEL